jgi:hypothetical protein
VLKALLAVAAAVSTGFVSVWYYHCGPGFDGTVASLKLADGSEYNVSQHWNSPGEPYQVSFYMKAPGGNWGWCYIDHQSDRWMHTKLEFDGKKDEVRVTENGKLMAVLNRAKKEFVLHRYKEPRSVPAPQTENQGPG